MDKQPCNVDTIADNINNSLRSLHHQLKQKEDKIEQLQKHVLWLETEMNDAKDDEIRKLKEENNELRKQLAEPQKEDTATQTIQHIESQNNAQTGRLVEVIEEKLKHELNTIKTDLVNIIDDKLSSQVKQLENSTATQHTYADAARSANTETDMTKLRTKILEEKNALLTEEMDKKNRNRNIIIHGKSEVDAAEDKSFAETLLKDIQIGSIPINQIERIGQKTETKPARRPIKLTFNREEDRNKVLNSLRNLKGSVAYKGVSITPDYTTSERLLIKEFHNEAKLRTYGEKENGTGYVWKIRGTPATGLFLKRFEENHIL